MKGVAFILTNQWWKAKIFLMLANYSAPNRALMSSCIGWSVLRLKYRAVLSLFHCWPKACSYVTKICMRLAPSSLVARQNIRLSSAKNKWEILGPRAHATTPFKNPLSTEDWMSAERPSAQISHRWATELSELHHQLSNNNKKKKNWLIIHKKPDEFTKIESENGRAPKPVKEIERSTVRTRVRPPV